MHSTIQLPILSSRLRGSLTALALAAATFSALAGGAHGVAAGDVPHLDHVVVILMENHGRGQVMGSSQAPFINSLAKRYAYADNYFAVTHPSLPNYIALLSGATDGISDDCAVQQCSVSATTLVDELDQRRAGAASPPAWRGYMESMTSPCSTSDAGGYTQHHDPFVYFKGILANKQRCDAGVVPLSDLSQDLRSGLPEYSLIVPNLCDDMHDCSVKTGDDWLAKEVPPILASPSFQSNAALFITWDEDDSGGDNSVPLIAAGPSIRRGVVTHQRANHYSLLRTIEDALGVPPVGANDATAQPLTELFQPAAQPSPIPSVTAPSPSVSPTPSPSPSAAPRVQPSLVASLTGTIAQLASRIGLRLPLPSSITAPAPAAPDHRVLWGVFQTDFPPSFAQIDALDRQLGRRADVVMWYSQWADGGGSGLANWNENLPAIEQTHARGEIPMITWESWGAGQRFSLADIAAGKFDPYIDSWAHGAAALKFPIWIRIFHEFNDDSEYPWQITKNSPQDFVAAWRHVHDRFTAAGATNVKWIWNPDGPGIDVAQIRSAYPGDQYVDYTGWDTYGYNDAADYRAVAAVSRKPMVLGEIGAHGGGAAAWLSSLGTQINDGSMPLVAGVIYFDEKGFALESDAQLMQAARAMLQGAAFRAPAPSPAPAPTPSPLPTPSPSATPSPSPTSTPLPTPPETPQPTPTPSPALATTPTPSPIIVPTPLGPTPTATPIVSPTPQLGPSLARAASPTPGPSAGGAGKPGPAPSPPAPSPPSAAGPAPTAGPTPGTVPSPSAPPSARAAAATPASAPGGARPSPASPASPSPAPATGRT